MSHEPGTFFAVVGPSGAGKDTLIAAAAARLEDNRRFRFVRRYITRPGSAGGEDHLEVTEAEFITLLRRNGFALSWKSHGLCYGIASEVQDVLSSGQHAIANISRNVIAQAIDTFANVRIVHVTASPAIIARRLQLRGREQQDDIARRMHRQTADVHAFPNVSEIDNYGTVDEGATRFLAILTARQLETGAPA